LSTPLDAAFMQPSRPGSQIADLILNLLNIPF
jgi:hypothetical protein